MVFLIVAPNDLCENPFVTSSPFFLRNKAKVMLGIFSINLSHCTQFTFLYVIEVIF